MSDHVQFNCVEVKQGEQTRLYLGAIAFKTLWPLCTVTPRSPRTDDPYYADTPNPTARYPQRIERPERLREIAEFVQQRLEVHGDSRKEVIFPGTVILGLLADIETHETLPQQPTPTAAHLVAENGRSFILLPELEASLFIIDGQHRIKGLDALHQRLSKEVSEIREIIGGGTSNEDVRRRSATLQLQLKHVEEFDVPITLLLDFDLEEQAMVFATVNFNQKPVPRSFYFDIFGAFESDKVTPLSYTHELVVHLQNSEKSPLRGMIKLLGSGPGLVSQAFMVARLVQLIDPQHPKSVFRFFFVLRQGGDKDASRQFAAIVRNFLWAVHDEFTYAWPTPNDRGYFSPLNYNFILCKSMVMSGLLALLREIYKVSLLDFAQGKETEVATNESMSRVFFREFLRLIDQAGKQEPANSIFSRNAPWAVGGSTKIERIIFESLRRDVFKAYIELIENRDSEYSRVCSTFAGRFKAAELARQHERTEQSFWVKTEELWEATSR